RVTRVAIIRDPFVPAGSAGFAAIQTVAPSFGVELTPVGLRGSDEIERGIAAFARGSNDGLIMVGPPSSAQVHRDLIIACAASATLRLLVHFLRQVRWPDLLRPRCGGSVPARRRLRRSHPQGREALRFTGAGANQVRADDQPQDREGARPHRARDTARPRRRGDRMKRRQFITLLGGAAAAWPLAARAQQAGKLWRIGFVSGAVRPPSLERSLYAGLSHGMRELGYVEGKDFVIEYRFAEGKYERFDDFASELVRLKVDAIVLATPAAVRAMQKATDAIPIVMGYS